jgi:hypothetical protein
MNGLPPEQFPQPKLRRGHAQLRITLRRLVQELGAKAVAPWKVKYDLGMDAMIPMTAVQGVDLSHYRRRSHPRAKMTPTAFAEPWRNGPHAELNNLTAPPPLSGGGKKGYLKRGNSLFWYDKAVFPTFGIDYRGSSNSRTIP